jgi:hypothetical protein
MNDLTRDPRAFFKGLDGRRDEQQPVDRYRVLCGLLTPFAAELGGAGCSSCTTWAASK